MRRKAIIVIVVLCLIVVAVVAGLMMQRVHPVNVTLLKQTFDRKTEGWKGTGDNAKASVTHDAADVRFGKGALRFEYGLNVGELNALVLSVDKPPPAIARVVRFWVKPDYNATLAFVVQERKPGGRYIAPFSASADRWQQVEVVLPEMVPASIFGEAPDPDGKLDVGQIAAVAILDVSQLGMQSRDAGLLDTFTRNGGRHTLFVDDFSVSTGTLAGTGLIGRNSVIVDSFERPQLCWTPLGSATLTISSGKPLDGRGLRADCRIAAGDTAGCIHYLKPGALAGIKRIHMTIAAPTPHRVLVRLEDTMGGKYEAPFVVHGGVLPQPMDMPIGEFKATPGAVTTAAYLDTATIKSVAVVDIGGAPAGTERFGTFWIGPVSAER